MSIFKDDTCFQFGAGNEVVVGCRNFDVSPCCGLPSLALIGRLFNGDRTFASNVLYGDIAKRLPLSSNSVKVLFALHVLEHLSYDDALTALKNSYKMFKHGGCFRLIVPNLKFYLDVFRTKLNSDWSGKSSSADDFSLLSELVWEKA